MFDGLFGRKFYSKCKISIRLTKVRMEGIKKKRNAVNKYLTKDIADLLQHGLHINAYGRAEGFLVEMNMTSCYDLIEHFYVYISTQLHAMDKQKDCPAECKEAVASLAYAAARFADMPELRDLRNLFTYRYGNSMETFVSKEFIEKLKAKPPTKNTKLQLLQDIAQDYSVEWNPKSLEQQLYNPPSPEHDSPKKDYFKNTYDDDFKGHKIRADDVLKTSKQHVASSQEEEDLSPRRKREVAKDEFKLPNNKGYEENQSQDRLVHQPSKDIPEVKSSNTAATDEKPVPFYSKFMPPPYFRPKAPPPDDHDGSEVPTYNKVMPPPYFKPKAPSDGGENQRQGDSIAEADKSKPRSVRRRNVKPPANDDHKDPEEGKLKPSSPYEKDQMTENLKHPPRANNNHGRTKSMQPETMMETNKTRSRATSFDEDVINTTGPRVHPKLPDYDDLAARIAALSSGR